MIPTSINPLKMSQTVLNQMSLCKGEFRKWQCLTAEFRTVLTPSAPIHPLHNSNIKCYTAVFDSLLVCLREGFLRTVTAATWLSYFLYSKKLHKPRRVSEHIRPALLQMISLPFRLAQMKEKQGNGWYIWRLQRLLAFQSVCACVCNCVHLWGLEEMMVPSNMVLMKPFPLHSHFH